jgi:hypothetical protein
LSRLAFSVETGYLITGGNRPRLIGVETQKTGSGALKQPLGWLHVGTILAPNAVKGTLFFSTPFSDAGKIILSPVAAIANERRQLNHHWARWRH